MPEENPTSPEWVNERQVARKYQISERSVRRMIAAGTLRAYRLGGRDRLIRMKTAEVDAALTAHPVVRP
jgi:excisionase family DNA binding protein